MLTKISLLLLLVTLGACTSVPLAPYKMEIQQGNVVTPEMLAKVKPGMTRAQVRLALGSPLIADAFHADRWDYVYRLEQRGKLIEERKLAVFFAGDKMIRVEAGGGAPAGNSTQAPAPAPTPIKNVTMPAPLAAPVTAPIAVPAPLSPKAAAPAPVMVAPPGGQAAPMRVQPSSEMMQPPAPLRPPAPAEKYDITVSPDSATSAVSQIKPAESKAKNDSASDNTPPNPPAKQKGFFGRMLEKIGL